MFTMFILISKYYQADWENVVGQILNLLCICAFVSMSVDNNSNNNNNNARKMFIVLSSMAKP